MILAPATSISMPGVNFILTSSKWTAAFCKTLRTTTKFAPSCGRLSRS
jgi:hypothetical protein